MAGIGLSADGAQIAGYVGENTCSSAGVPTSTWSSGKKHILKYGPRLPAGMDALGGDTDGGKHMMELILADASIGDLKKRKKAWGHAKCMLKALEMAATSALVQEETEAAKEEDEAAKESTLVHSGRDVDLGQHLGQQAGVEIRDADRVGVPICESGFEPTPGGECLLERDARPVQQRQVWR